MGCDPGTAGVKLVAEPGVGDTGRTLGSEGITGERGALGISSRACVSTKSQKFQVEQCRVVPAIEGKKVSQAPILR